MKHILLSIFALLPFTVFAADFSDTTMAWYEEWAQAAMYDCADIISPYDTPWCVIMAGEKAVDFRPIKK